MNDTEIIGYIATALIVLAYIPQVRTVIKNKNANGIAIEFIVTMMTSCILWCVYGFYKDSIPIILTNSLSLLQLTILLHYKFKQ